VQIKVSYKIFIQISRFQEEILSNSKPNFEKKSYKEFSSLFDGLQIHILFEIFGAW
jgi:hypothetical protein